MSEITGVPAKDIERIAVEYASAKPASIWAGTGINHWYHGDLIGRAVIELGCLTGNIGRQGGGVSPWAGQYLMRLNPTDYFFPKKPGGKPDERYRAVPLDTAYVVNGPTDTMFNKAGLWRQIRCIWAAGGNLLGEASDQSNLTRNVLPQIELIVSPEIEMSTTAQLADIVLPVVSWFELPYDIATTPAHPYIQLHEGGLEPMFEAKTDIWIYHELCKRLGTADRFKFTRPEEAIELLLETGGPQVKGITFERLKKERTIRVNLPSSPYASFTEEIEGKKKFKTASGRQELYKDEDRFIQFGEQLPVHKEPHVATPYGTSKVWKEAKKERNPLYEKYPMVYHCRHTRWSVHSSWRTTTDITKLDDIGQPVGHPRGGREPVAAGSSGLLVVALDALGQVQVRDEPDVRLVDAHAEGDGGHHHHPVLAQEAGLVGRAHRPGQPRVVRQRDDPLLGERLGGLLHRLARQAVDDAGVPVVLAAQQAHQLLQRLLLGLDPVLNVRTIEAGHEHPGLPQPQPLDDLAARRRGRGSGQRDSGDGRPPVVEHRQPQVVGTEVVPPLRHTVRLVDREQRDVQPVQEVLRPLHPEPLGRQVEQVQFAGQGRPLGRRPLVGRDARVQEAGAHPERLHRGHLVVHQRDQRRDHDPDPRTHHGRNLIAQRLTAAGGHQDERVPAIDDVVDDLLLVAAERVVAERQAQDVESGGRSGHARHARPRPRQGRTLGLRQAPHGQTLEIATVGVRDAMSMANHRRDGY